MQFNLTVARRTAILLSVLACGCASERVSSQRALPTSMPAVVDGWNDGTVVRVQFLRGFRLADYKSVLVLPADTSSVRLPGRDENTYAPVTAILSSTTDLFVGALRTKLKNIIPVNAATSASGGGKTLNVRMQVRVIDPGSAALRFWLGRGATYMDISGDIVDGETGQPLLRFEDEDRGTGKFLFHIGYEYWLSHNVETIGQHVGILLEAF